MKPRESLRSRANVQLTGVPERQGNREVIPTSRQTSGTQHRESPASLCQARPRGKTCVKADRDISEHQGTLDDARWGGGGEQGSEPMPPPAHGTTASVACGARPVCTQQPRMLERRASRLPSLPGR